MILFLEDVQLYKCGDTIRYGIFPCAQKLTRWPA